MVKKVLTVSTKVFACRKPRPLVGEGEGFDLQANTAGFPE